MTRLIILIFNILFHFKLYLKNSFMLQDPHQNFLTDFKMLFNADYLYHYYHLIIILNFKYYEQIYLLLFHLNLMKVFGYSKII